MILYEAVNNTGDCVYRRLLITKLHFFFLLVSRLENCSGNGKSYLFPFKNPHLMKDPSVQISWPTVQRQSSSYDRPRRPRAGV